MPWIWENMQSVLPVTSTLLTSEISLRKIRDYSGIICIENLKTQAITCCTYLQLDNANINDNDELSIDGIQNSSTEIGSNLEPIQGQRYTFFNNTVTITYRTRSSSEHNRFLHFSYTTQGASFLEIASS